MHNNIPSIHSGVSSPADSHSPAPTHAFVQIRHNPGCDIHRCDICILIGNTLKDELQRIVMSILSNDFVLANDLIDKMIRFLNKWNRHLIDCLDEDTYLELIKLFIDEKLYIESKDFKNMADVLNKVNIVIEKLYECKLV